MAGLCLATLFLLRDWTAPEPEDLVSLLTGVGFILLLDLGAILGLIGMVVGLVMAGTATSVKGSGQ